MTIRKFVAGVLTAIALILCFPQQVRAEHHEKIFGVKAGWISRNESALAGLAFQYRFSEHFRLGADAEIAFRNKDRDALLIDIDTQYPIDCSSRVEFYPILGANFSAWSLHQTIEEEEESNDVTSRTSRFGLNFGCGLGVKVSQTLRLNFEARGTLVKGNNAARITAGIAYVF